MHADDQKTERVVKLLPETFPEPHGSQAEVPPDSPEQAQASQVPLLLLAARQPASHGIRELASALSE